MTTSQKPLTPGEETKAMSDIYNAERRLFHNSPLSPEWDEALDDINRLRAMLTGNVTTSTGEPECKPSDSPAEDSGA